MPVPVAASVWPAQSGGTVMAEGAGFEPADACASPVFKTGAFSRSATPPRAHKHTPGVPPAHAVHSATVEVFAGLVPVFVILAVGVAARQAGLLDEGGAAGLNRLVAQVALPALLLIKVGTASLADSFSPAVVAVTTGLVLATTVVALVLGKMWRLPGSQVGVLAQAAQRGNLAYVAFPVILAAGGEAALRAAAVTAAVLIPVMNLLAVVVLERYRGKSPKHAVAVRVLANPLVVSALAGLALAALNWRPWKWLAASLEIVADFALPGALLALGAQLTLGRWGKVWKPLVAAAALKLLVQPALGWWLLTTLHASRQEMLVGVLLLAAPSAVASYPVAVELGGDRDLAAAAVVVTTTGAVLTYLLWGVLLGGG